ncbi:acylneuraminate cytidylyltransferase family protein [Patescibacteria group bacterium]|nr:acylneuraminate cytidylyltransferase family protein [Patescibacteria group bacterium]
MKKKKILALIPARGGSKSIPKKNIYPILGKPVIFYTIEAAKRSGLIDRIIVSTDDEEIAAIAREYGAETPFLRPSKLAEDNTPDLPVFQHALSWLKEKENYQPDIIIHLWPTSPFRKDGDIDKAIDLLLENPEADSVRSITVPSQTPFKMWRTDKEKYLSPILKKEHKEFYKTNPEPHTLPRQLLPKTFVQTGYLGVIHYKTIMRKNSMTGKKIIPFFHDPSLYTELDSMKDLMHTLDVLKKHYR